MNLAITSEQNPFDDLDFTGDYKVSFKPIKDGDDAKEWSKLMKTPYAKERPQLISQSNRFMAKALSAGIWIVGLQDVEDPDYKKKKKKKNDEEEDD